MATNLPSRMEQAAQEPCITRTCELCGTVWQARTDAATRGHRAGECKHAFEGYRCGAAICDACLANGGAYHCDGCGKLVCSPAHAFTYGGEMLCFACFLDTFVIDQWKRNGVEVVAA